ncbi:hypothetical protein [Actinoplanes auranticolor]|nr:hypothetical protein [Actinoplanes auranticolor]
MRLIKVIREPLPNTAQAKQRASLRLLPIRLWSAAFSVSFKS